MKKCLLIIDTQNGFINNHTKHIPKLVEKIQYDFKYVFVTKFYNPKDSFYRKLIKWNNLSKNSFEYQLAFNVKEDAIIIEKEIYSCVNKNFLDKLQKNDILKVYICGIDTDICVTKCSVDLFENRIVPIVLKNFCASTAGIQAHNCAISTLRRYIGNNQVI